jgi:hypothetical protein
LKANFSILASTLFSRAPFVNARPRFADKPNPFHDFREGFQIHNCLISFCASGSFHVPVFGRADIPFEKKNETTDTKGLMDSTSDFGYRVGTGYSN